MKNKLIVLTSFLLLALYSQSQITLDKVIKKTEKKIENRTEKKIDKTINKGLDKVEDDIDDAFKGDKKDQKNDNSNPVSTKKDETQEPNNSNKSTATVKNENTQTDEKPDNKPTLNWAKYDFVPGTEIIFEDNQEGEQNGEFPSKWDLVQGNFENANFDGFNVIYHIKCNMNGGGGIIPMMKNCKEDYLPEEFTIEFDAYFTENFEEFYTIYFLDYKNQKDLEKTIPQNKKWIRIYKNSVNGESIDKNYYPGYKSGMFDKTPKWRHVAISFNKRALKVYLDDARVLNIPNLGYNPTGFTIGKQAVDGKDPGYTKNFRIAKGAVPLYDKLLTDGKFVTTGIKFDVNKATIKPESMGVINEIVKLMTEKPELKFSVEGHTDSDGEEAANLKLSEARAKAVMDKMIELGISGDRLKFKGLGESKPLGDNSTPEGKATNRRVEFIKF